MIVLQNGATGALKRLTVAVLIVDNNLPLMTVLQNGAALKAFDCSSSNSGIVFSKNGACRRPQMFDCSSSNSGQQLTSNDSFYRMVLPTPSNNGAADALKRLTVAVLIVDKQLTSNDSFYRMVLPTPQTFGCSSSNSGQQLTSNDSFLQNGAADALKHLTVAVLIEWDNNLPLMTVFTEWCCDALKHLTVAVLIVDNNLPLMIVFYRMVLLTPQTFDCSSSNSGQQLTSNDSFLQNGAADASNNGAADAQMFDCSSSNSGQQLTSNDSFLQNGAARRLKRLTVVVLIVDKQLISNDSFLQNGAAEALKRLAVANGAADALKRLTVAVLIVDNNSPLMTVFYRKPTPQTPPDDNNLPIALQNLAVAVLIVDNNLLLMTVFYRMPDALNSFIVAVQ
ncbi:unnamed protein product [Mytilus edulis]|uniref:Uncharacterized protein n=1 Tax=Mytilus edulis TaxID=6550 RepID=A0A8S3V940_MYTED|nr:unnamed protein product [Mytilus edulis]